MSLAALGAVAGGLNQGYDLAQKDQELKDQRAFRTEDRTFKKLQQDDLLARQARENEKAARDDQYGKDYAAANGPVTETKPVTGQPALDAFANEQPSPADVTTQRPRTELERLAAVKDAQVKGQRFTDAEQTQTAMRKIFTDVDRQNYNTLLQSASDMDMTQLAASAQKMVTADGSPLIADESKQNADGSYTFNVRNKWNGTAMPFTVRNKEDLLRGLQYHMDYETYAANTKAAQVKRDKIEEAQAAQRPTAVGVNGALVPDGKGGWTKVAGSVDGTTGADKGGAGGGKAADPFKPYADAFEMAAIKGETKLTPNQIADGNRIVSSLAASGYDQGTAVKVTLDLATDPTKARLEINKRTGEVDRVYRNPDVNRGESIIISRGAGSLKDMEKQAGGPAQMKAAVLGMIDEILPPGSDQERATARTQLISIAANKEQRAKYLAAAKEAGKDVAAISRQLDLVAEYAKPDAPRTENKPGSSWLDKFKGGLGGSDQYVPPAGSPVAKARARNEQIAEKRRTDEAQKQAANTDRVNAIMPSVQQIIGAKDRVGAAKLQASDDFSLLPKDRQMDIWKIVNGQ